MSAPTRSVREWLASRGMGFGAVRRVLDKPLPRNVSWLHSLGSLLLLYLGFQVLTGVLLGLYYSPGPDDAYQSVRYVRDELVLGSLLLNLHRAGAGFIMVTAFLHFARSYFLAAYKPPRELLWMTGLLLGVLLTLFAFTGQLLPYDQKGYWATVVGLEIAGSAPLVGEPLRQLLTGGYGSIGATTLSRFYVLHVSVLPLLLVALGVLHLSILQRVGPAGPTGGSPEPRRPFFPSQLFKDVMVAAAGAFALILVASLLSVVDTGPADPAAGGFVPRPEWYFLAHYTLLRILPGDLQILGTFVLPNLVLGLLFALPFLDRGSERRLRRRPGAVIAGSAGVLLLVGMTLAGLSSEPETATTAAADEGGDPVARGRRLFEARECVQCHAIGGEGGDAGPPLDGVGARLRGDYLRRWIRNPQAFDPTTEMPALDGTEEELEAIVSYLTTLTTR